MLRIASEQPVDLGPVLQALTLLDPLPDVGGLLAAAVQSAKDKVAAACSAQQAIIEGYATATSKAPGPPDQTGKPTTITVQHPWHGKEIKFHPVRFSARVRDGLLWVEAAADYTVAGPPPA